MSLKKRLLSVLLLLCLLIGLLEVGFSGMKIPKELRKSSALTSNKETIYFWYTDDALTDYINSAAINFTEIYGVRVIPVLKSGTEYLEAVNDASLQGEQMPDVYLLSNDLIGKANMAGLTTDVSDSIYCNTEYFPESALSAVTYHGDIVAYPYYYETSAYLYNKTYLKDFVKTSIEQSQDKKAADDAQKKLDEDGEPSEETEENIKVEEPLELTEEELEQKVQELLPETMSDLLAFADVYNAPENVESILKWDVSDIFYNYYFIGNYMVVGGESGDDTSQIDIYNQEAMDCLKAYQKLNQFFYIDPEMVTYDSVLQDFIEGKVVFSVVTNDAIARLEQAKEDGTFGYEYGIMQVPKISDSLEGRSLSVTNAVAVNGYTNNQENAKLFAEFITVGYLDNLYKRTGKMASGYLAPLTDENIKQFMMEYEHSIPMPKMIETSNFWLQLEILFSKVWRGENINDLVRGLSEQMMTQITGEPFEEEYIKEVEEEMEESVEYIDDGEQITEDDVIEQ